MRPDVVLSTSFGWKKPLRDNERGQICSFKSLFYREVPSNHWKKWCYLSSHVSAASYSEMSKCFSSHQRSTCCVLEQREGVSENKGSSRRPRPRFLLLPGWLWNQATLDGNSGRSTGRKHQLRCICASISANTLLRRQKSKDNVWWMVNAFLKSTLECSKL